MTDEATSNVAAEGPIEEEAREAISENSEASEPSESGATLVRDYNTELPADGKYEETPPPDTARYVLEDVADSPIEGHQQQVLIKEQ